MWFVTVPKWFIPLLSLIVIIQSQTLTDLSRNFCREIAGEDNFSCANNPIEQGICFSRNHLCQDFTCADKGESVSINSLECKFELYVWTILLFVANFRSMPKKYDLSWVHL